MAPAEVEAVAIGLVGGPVERVAPVRGAGRNSRVWRVERGGQSFALKHYPVAARARVEAGALDLMTAHGIDCVPRVFGLDPRRGYALFEWIAGEPVDAPQPPDIDDAARFLAAVHALRDGADAAAQPAAAEACRSGAEIVAQIEGRFSRLAALGGDEPELTAFLAARLRPLAIEVAAWAEAEYRNRTLDFAAPVPGAAQTLCPSDFGFHNALRRPVGALAFFDFDYFGWDDPVKLVSDFMLHPGMRLDDGLKQRFVTGVLAVYGGDRAFADRLRVLYPLFAVRWCLILLNEFLPERWAYRVHAGAEDAWAAAKRRQLDRAGEWVQSLAANFRRFPYA